MTTVAQILQRMIRHADGNLHDIDHLLKVWAYAKTIGELEGVDGETQQILEIAAIVHDIACPLCREKYGNTNGKLQELEGGPLARAFLRDTDLPDSVIDRVAYLVAHHHSPQCVYGLDYQILLEADYLVNADEGGDSYEHIQHTMAALFRTASGVDLLKAAYRKNN